MINLTQSVQKIALNALWIDEVCTKDISYKNDLLGKVTIYFADEYVLARIELLKVDILSKQESLNASIEASLTAAIGKQIAWMLLVVLAPISAIIIILRKLVARPSEPAGQQIQGLKEEDSRLRFLPVTG